MINKSDIYKDTQFFKESGIFKNILFFILVLILQSYWPPIPIRGESFQVDVVLIYITILAIMYGRFNIIIVAFFAGLIQDAILTTSFGVFSLSKSVAVFCIGSIFYYRTIWSKHTQYLVIFSSYLIHFIISSYLIRGINGHIIYILVSSILSFILLIIINNLIYKNRLLSN